jgi:epoxyqueuosine reductase QueG
MGVRMGQARLAVVTNPDRDDACDYCQRCLWGCPKGSIYNPVSTLKQCEKYASFNYVSGRYVLSLLANDNKISEMLCYCFYKPEISVDPHQTFA